MRRATLLLILTFGLGMGSCSQTLKPGDPLSGLTPGEQDRFRRGEAVFRREFTPASGLGPLFNSTACFECHEDPAAGGAGDEIELHATQFLGGDSCDLLVAEGGPVIQQHATPALEAALGIDQEPFPKHATGRGLRTAPALFARGLLDAVSDSEILSHADPDDRDQDGISGRPNRSVDGRIGRFGRKAFVPALKEFNEGAFVVEMGITNPAQPTEESIGGRPIPPGVDPVPDPEIGQEDVDLTDDFVRFLAPPTPAPLTREGRYGRELFHRIGCAACHIPKLRTGDSPVSAIRYRSFPAYTDLLLHDMGAGRADICLGLAKPSEFRTEPLIGLRFAKRFLHDAAAMTLEQAIELHDGEAAAARDRFKRLAPKDSAAVLAFLKTL